MEAQVSKKDSQKRMNEKFPRISFRVTHAEKKRLEDEAVRVVRSVSNLIRMRLGLVRE